MTTWHWVRHGPTHEKTFVGWRDVPADLSDHAQIARLSDHLPKRAVLVSSDLVRCVKTADALQTPDRQRLPHHQNLREMHFGDWDGRHFADVAETDPDLSRAYWETPGDVQAPGGESWNQAAQRVQLSVDQLNTEHPEADIIAVAHFGVILTQIQRALGQDAAQVLAHKIDNFAVTRLTHQNGSWGCAVINHLP